MPSRSGRSARFALVLAPLAVTWGGAFGAPSQDCVRPQIVLWGDGRHDDTVALNAWLRGDDAIWGENGEAVGSVIAGRRFRLSAAIYVTGGSGRRLEDFRLLWPERAETVSGGTILSGSDPDKAPVVTGVSISGGDPDEGKPFESPEPAMPKPDPAASCATS
jgi:hypothetical protein